VGTPAPASTANSAAEAPVAAPDATGGDAAAIEAVRAAVGDALLEVIAFRGETTLVVAKGAILDVLRTLRDEPLPGFDRLSDLTAVDYLDLGREPRFAVVYHLMARRSLARLRVRALVPEEEPFIASAVELYPGANWLEREVYDMFGIGFLGHPNLTRILMPDDWEGHPLRKDFPIGAEEVQFSFNPEVVGGPVVPLSEGEGRYHVSAHTLGQGGEEP
jgi:NADH-quinone oxidoreductase subunit C